MGVAGAVLITKWSIGLPAVRSVLLDQQGPSYLEKNHQPVDRVTMWLSGGGSARVVHRAEHFFDSHCGSKRSTAGPCPYQRILKDIPEIVHSTVEVHPTLQRDSEPRRLLKTISINPF